MAEHTLLARPPKPRRDRSRRFVSPGARPYVTAVLCLVAFIFTFPFIWTLLSSVKANSDLFAYPPRILPTHWKFGNYVQVWNVIPFGRYVLNTLEIVVLSVVGDLISCSLVAYGFARFKFPGRNILFVLMLSALMLPDEVVIIPQFLIFKELGWLDSFKPLIVPSFIAYGAFNIFLFHQFFLGIPRELANAAEIDGAGPLRIWWSIYLPLSRPVMATVGVLSFLYHWNDFLKPLIYLNSENKFTLSLGLQAFAGTAQNAVEPQQQLLMSSAIMMTIPVVVLFYLAQNYIVSGVQMQGVRR